jgi:mono/diheme cytochrome c family protein
MRGVIAAVLLAAVSTPLSSIATRAWAQDAALVEQGQRAFMNQGCYGCHRVGKIGTPVARDLSHIGAKYGSDYLERWLRGPSDVRPSTHMPTLELTDDDIRSIAAFLATRQ